MNSLLGKKDIIQPSKKAISFPVITLLVAQLLSGCGENPEERQRRIEKIKIERDNKSSELLTHFNNGGTITCTGVGRDTNQFTRFSATIGRMSDKKGEYGENIFIVDKKMNAITPDILKGKNSGKYTLATECEKIEKQ